MFMEQIVLFTLEPSIYFCYRKRGNKINVIPFYDVTYHLQGHLTRRILTTIAGGIILTFYGHEVYNCISSVKMISKLYIVFVITVNNRNPQL